MYQHIFLINKLSFPTSLVPRNQLLSVAAACKVLIEFSLLRLENPDEACAVSQVRRKISRRVCNCDEAAKYIFLCPVHNLDIFKFACLLYIIPF